MMKVLRDYKEGIDYYIDPETGRFVWTESALLARGYCCNNSCRHCPYRSAQRIDIVYEKKRRIVPPDPHQDGD